MKCKIKKIAVLTLILIIFYSFFYAISIYSIDLSKADKFISNGQEGDEGLNTSSLNSIGAKFSDIGSLLVYIGAGILVACTGYIGIMYMVSSPEKRAKLKQQLIGVLVAGIVIFGAYSIWSILVNILSETIDK